jgi:hypothetical protein
LDDQDSYSVTQLNMDVPFSPKALKHTIDNTFGKINLTWLDKSFDESSFEVFRGIGNVYESIAKLNANSTTMIDSIAAPLKNYTYKVRAQSSFGNSSFSNALSVSTQDWIAPVIPSALTNTLSADYKTVSLTWTDGSQNEAGFELERSINGEPFALRKKLVTNSTQFIDDFTFDSQYSFRIRAYNKFGKSDYSAIASLPIVTELKNEFSDHRIYPNPFRDKLNISFTGDSHNLVVVIYDITGRKVFTGSMGIQELDLSELPVGIYILKVTCADTIGICKVEKR